MFGIRELTCEEIEEVSGGGTIISGTGAAGTPTVYATPTQGVDNFTYIVNCGTGYSAYAPFNPNTTGLSTWTNFLNYGCSSGGAAYFSFFSQGGVGGGFMQLG